MDHFNNLHKFSHKLDLFSFSNRLVELLTMEDYKLSTYLGLSATRSPFDYNSQGLGRDSGDNNRHSSRL